MNPSTNCLGDKVWWNKEDEFHRLDGPAIKWANGKKFYYIDDEYYNNFIEYIQAVIEYKKDNNL